MKVGPVCEVAVDSDVEILVVDVGSLVSDASAVVEVYEVPGDSVCEEVWGLNVDVVEPLSICSEEAVGYRLLSVVPG